MGNEPSKEEPRKPALRSVSSNVESSFLMITNENAEVFHFEPKETFMIAYAIDKQTSPKFKHRTLSSATTLDAHQVCMALVDKAVLPKDHVQLFPASKHVEMCSIAGMKDSFQQHAKRAGEKGLFIFHFSGHGIKAGNEWGLAPADFDYSEATYLTGSVLNHWLIEAGCKAQHVLFILDCCYAGGLAQEMTRWNAELRPGLYVLSACTAFETSLVIGPLGHSIFAYFLAYALRVIRFATGKLPITKVFNECSELSLALSSLLISYNADSGLRVGTMQPELKFFDLHHHVGQTVEETLRPVPVSSVRPPPGDLTFVSKYYKRYLSREGEEEEEAGEVKLSALCLRWLENIADVNHSPLWEFVKRRLLKDEILRAAICAIMWSVASIQVEEERATANHPDIFLLGFLHAAAAFKFFHGVALDLENLRESWTFYQAVISANGISDGHLQLLYKDICQDCRLKEDSREDDGSDILTASRPVLETDGEESVRSIKVIYVYVQCAYL